jgi:hypothetical protein
MCAWRTAPVSEWVLGPAIPSREGVTSSSQNPLSPSRWRGDRISKHLNVLERTRLWSWVWKGPKTKLTVLASTSSNLPDRPTDRRELRKLANHCAYRNSSVPEAMANSRHYRTLPGTRELPFVTCIVSPKDSLPFFKTFWTKIFFYLLLLINLLFLLSSYFYSLYIFPRRLDRTVGIVTGYGLGGQGSIPGRGRMFLFSIRSRPTLRPTESPITWVPGTISPD